MLKEESGLITSTELRRFYREHGTLRDGIDRSDATAHGYSGTGVRL